jgi:orotidine-5'-phosphate decarboxylase
MHDPKLIIALDSDQRATIDRLVGRLDPAFCRLKIGKQAFTLFGPDLVRSVQDKGFQVFLDLKFHDIPNTVACAVSAAAELGVWMTNVHAMGGERMLEAAAKAAGKSNPEMHLIAVTVLTSHAQGELDFLGCGDNAALVERLTAMSLKAGLGGVVCSAREASGLRQCFGAGPLLVTPGIRPVGSAADDQRRTMTPADAMAAGASYLVVGRPVTASDDPHRAVLTLIGDLSDSAGEVSSLI